MVYVYISEVGSMHLSPARPLGLFASKLHVAGILNNTMFLMGRQHCLRFTRYLVRRLLRIEDYVLEHCSPQLRLVYLLLVLFY